MTQKFTIIHAFSWFFVLTASVYAMDPSENLDSQLLHLTHTTNTLVDESDDEMAQAIRRRLEGMYVEEVRADDTNPEPGSKVIRRTWDDYVRQFKNHHVVLFSGHKGEHSGTYGTTQGPEYYMIDNCWEEVSPDAVLDVRNPLQMRYIPDEQVDTIVADDQRFLSDEAIASLLRVLKPSGKIVFRPGSGMGWPSYAISGKEPLVISESGRHASGTFAKVQEINSNTTTRDAFKAKALEKASTFYKKMGFREVTFEQEYFVLSK